MGNADKISETDPVESYLSLSMGYQKLNILKVALRKSFYQGRGSINKESRAHLK